MNITSTHFKLMKCLSVDNYTLNELYLIFDIPEFKLRKYLKDLEYLLNCSSVNSIHIFLKNNPEKIKELKKMQNFSSDERTSFIIIQLLMNKFINLTEVSRALDVTRRTIANDLSVIKPLLNEFNLKIESINSIGIAIDGLESDKRKFFWVYIIKIFKEKDFLPFQFNFFFSKIEELNKEHEINSSINRIFKKLNLKRYSINTLFFKSMAYTFILRNRFADESLLKSEKKIFPKELEDALSSLKFYSEFEKNAIFDFFSERNKLHLSNYYTEEKEKAIKLMDAINEKFNYDLTMTENLLENLIVAIMTLDFKEKYNITSFYNFNRNMSSHYSDKFLSLFEFLKDYIPYSDSFDITFIATTILNNISLQLEKRIDMSDNILVVYNLFDKDFLKGIFKELGFARDFSNLTFLFIDEAQDYMSNNKVKNIITFEDVSSYNFDTEILTLNFPVTRADKIKILNHMVKK